ncbi:MAG: hypothetical protein LBT43_03385 [Prevotella sp.]|jgi:hypothetical protein|nr:hypothetical protein [Prevotella sp.]
MSEMNLKSEVEQLLAEIDRTHRYSMSKIYNLANRVFNKNEIPQSCASCLIRKTRELRSWLNMQESETEVPKTAVETQAKKRKSKKTGERKV